jgi:hypothetical protein
MGGFSLDMLGESDEPSQPVRRIFSLVVPTFFYYCSVIFGPILTQICVIYICMNTFNTAVKILLT